MTSPHELSRLSYLHQRSLTRNGWFLYHLHAGLQDTKPIPFEHLQRIYRLVG